MKWRVTSGEVKRVGRCREQKCLPQMAVAATADNERKRPDVKSGRYKGKDNSTVTLRVENVGNGMGKCRLQY